MRKLMIAVTALQLTACAVTPQELQEQGERLEFTAARPPIEAASCMVRNAQRKGPGGVPRMNLGKKPGTAEFHMTAMFYAVLEPTAQGSRGTVWLLPHSVIDKHAMWDAVIKGC